MHTYLDARRLHSMTLISLSLAMNCMLKGPDTCSCLAILRAAASILRTVTWSRSCAGRMSVASPECTPAFSTCSEMASAMISPSCATASRSTSFAFMMNCT